MRQTKKCILVVCLLILPVYAIAANYKLFLKDGTSFETSYYWVEDESTIGYYQNDELKYIDKDKIDLDKTNQENNSGLYEKETVDTSTKGKAVKKTQKKPKSAGKKNRKNK